MPNAKKPSGIAEPYGRTTTRTCGWMLTQVRVASLPVTKRRRAAPSALCLLELDRRRVDAVAQPRRLRAVREHVPEMAAAVGARHLGPHHAGADVRLLVE